MTVLPPRVIGVSASAPPARCLTFDLQAQNPYSGQISFVELVVEIRIAGGPLLHDSCLGRLRHGTIPNILMVDGEKMMALELVVPMPAPVLAAIEAHRLGRDVEFEFRGNIEYSIAHVVGGGGHWSLGERRRANFGDPYGGLFRHTIPQSEWIKLLQQLRWSEVELLEVPRIVGNLASLSRAYKNLKEASDALRKNDVDVCMIKCRKAYEAAIRDLTGLDDTKAATEKLLDGMQVEKRAEINNLLLALAGLLHLARHERAQEIHFSRSEAIAALHISTAVIELFGSLGP